jgi:MarR family transcriptional regulator, organic hydroperoxide resistance regulator
MNIDDESAVNREILDTLTDLVKQAGAVGHSIAAGLGATPSDLLALFKLDGVLTMKELAQRMGCDASFVTAIADALERHGFARRAPSEKDRRVKHLLLTEEGIAAKERMMRELAARMPWCYALDEAERQCFLGLLKKMVDAARAQAGTTQETGSPGAGATVRSE